MNARTRATAAAAVDRRRSFAPVSEDDESARGPARRDRKDRRPATPRGIEAQWRGGRWRYRARRQVAGKARVGRWRGDVATALEDRAELEQSPHAFRGRAQLTLAEAIDQVIRAARRRGVAERTIVKTYLVTSRFLQRLLGADRPLRELNDPGVVAAFVLEARDHHAASTVWRKDCWLLSAALQRGELRDPIPALRREMQRSGTMKPVPPRRVWLRLDEIRGVLARMRAGTVQPGRRVPPRAEREAEADIVELLAVTGARCGEFARVKLADVELGEGGARVYVAEPKDRSNPRTCEVPASSRAALERQVARARELGAAHLVPGGEDELEALFARWRKLLDDRRLSGRVLRRSFLTACAQASNDMTVVMAAGGHRHASTTSKYIALVDTKQRELAEAIGAALCPPNPSVPQ